MKVNTFQKQPSPVKNINAHQKRNNYLNNNGSKKIPFF